jgi:hypothetical protein
LIGLPFVSAVPVAQSVDELARLAGVLVLTSLPVPLMAPFSVSTDRGGLFLQDVAEADLPGGEVPAVFDVSLPEPIE